MFAFAEFPGVGPASFLVSSRLFPELRAPDTLAAKKKKVILITTGAYRVYNSTLSTRQSHQASI
jgi:hypothetical protein